MTTAQKIVVVGAGIMGSSVACSLAERLPDADVVLLDSQPGVFGATAYSPGIIRRHHTLAADARLSGESLAVYRHWGAAVGGDCGYRPVGFLMLADRSQEKAVHANADAGAPWGMLPEQLDADELRLRFPELLLREEDIGIFEPDGGYGSPTLATAGWQAAFRARGGGHQVGVLAGGLIRRGSGWAVQTNIGRIEADQVVVANGMGAAPLLETVGLTVPVTPRRIGLAHIRLPSRPGAGPRTPSCIDDVTGTYFAPRDNGLLAVGVRARPECDPDRQVVPLSADEIEEARSRGAQRIRGLTDVATVGSQVSGDGYTPDNRPILGAAHQDLPGLHIAAGFSGGGFKIAPAVGEHVSAVVAGLPTPEQIRPYRLGRFEDGEPLVGEHLYAYM